MASKNAFLRRYSEPLILYQSFSKPMAYSYICVVSKKMRQEERFQPASHEHLLQTTMQVLTACITTKSKLDNWQHTFILSIW